MLIVAAEIEGRAGQQIRLQADRIVEIGPWLQRRPGEPEIDARGGAVIPGLHDHHVHLRSAAAALSSVDLGPHSLRTRGCGWQVALRQASAQLPEGEWLRGIGMSGAWADSVTRSSIDAVVSERPVRLQHRTGELWVLNSAAIIELAVDRWSDVGVEREPDGTPTGRLWRLDTRLGDEARTPPDRTGQLGRVSDEALRAGITGFTDATPGLTAAGLEDLESLVADHIIRQRLTAMAGPELHRTSSRRVRLVACKIVLDDATLPTEMELADVVRASHSDGIPVAIHCVTATQLVVAVAGLASAGPRPGDRVEHAGVVPTGYAAQLAGLGTTVVTQPGFVFARGDDYLRDVARPERDWLYPCASLQSADVLVAAGSDAPFGPLDPWLAMRTATTRRTASGADLGVDERIGPAAALALYLGSDAAPGRPRRVTVGEPGELCLLRAPLSDVLADLGVHQVAGAVVHGKAYQWDD